ncbi:MAG: hypothetical protein V4534_04380 [Myxococcota bacterium]
MIVTPFASASYDAETKKELVATSLIGLCGIGLTIAGAILRTQETDDFIYCDSQSNYTQLINLGKGANICKSNTTSDFKGPLKQKGIDKGSFWILIVGPSMAGSGLIMTVISLYAGRQTTTSQPAVQHI